MDTPSSNLKSFYEKIIDEAMFHLVVGDYKYKGVRLTVDIEMHEEHFASNLK